VAIILGSKTWEKWKVHRSIGMNVANYVILNNHGTHVGFGWLKFEMRLHVTTSPSCSTEEDTKLNARGTIKRRPSSFVLGRVGPYTCSDLIRSWRL
jgi:hypothetical protein